MANAAQSKTYNFIRDEIARLRGPQSYVPLSLDEVTPIQKESDRATFLVSGARVFIENSGELVEAGLPDCPRYADCLLKDSLPAIAADLLMEGNPHKPFLDINSHTRESFESYLQTGIPLQRELPFPIAIVSRKLGNEANGMRGFYLLLDLFDVVVRFIALVQIADFMRDPQTQAEVLAKVPRLDKFLRTPPTLGAWVELFCSLRQFQIENPFLIEIGAANIDRKMLEHFRDLRNDTRGHGNTESDAYYRTIFEQNIGEIEQLLRAVSFLKNYWLIKPISIAHSGADCEFSAWKLTGDNPSFDKRYLRSSSPLTTDKVYYLNQKREALELDPYIIVELCKECDREELLLFDGLSKESEKDITYLGYESCPKRHKSPYPYADKLPLALRKASRRAR